MSGRDIADMDDSYPPLAGVDEAIERGKRIQRAGKSDPPSCHVCGLTAGCGDPDRCPAKPPADMPDAKLNAAVAREVMGWTIVPDGERTSQKQRITSPSRIAPYATDIAAAFEVVGEMAERGLRVLICQITREPRWRVVFEDAVTEHMAGIGECHEMCGPYPLPRAICEAALAAVRSET